MEAGRSQGTAAAGARWRWHATNGGWRQGFVPPHRTILLYCPAVPQEDSSPDYLVKAEDCLRDEEERVNSYFHFSTKPKLLKEVRLGWGGGSGREVARRWQWWRWWQAGVEAALLGCMGWVCCDGRSWEGGACLKAALSSQRGPSRFPTASPFPFPPTTLPPSQTSACLPACPSGRERAAQGAPDAAAREGAQRLRGAASRRQGGAAGWLGRLAGHAGWPGPAACDCAAAQNMPASGWPRTPVGLHRQHTPSHGPHAMLTPPMPRLPCPLPVPCPYRRRRTWGACTACSTGCPRGWSPWQRSSGSMWRRRVSALPRRLR